jgi:hypothetical protein
LLAIVIPYYKLTFFKATLESLALQTDNRFKVYIGDDASPENPSELLQRFQGKFDFVYHRFENNLGRTSLTQHWERCIGLVNKEEWLMILGDDDVLEPNVVQALYESLNQILAQEIDVVRFATAVIDENSKIISNEIYTHPEIEKSTDFLFRKLSYQTRSSLSEYVFRKSVLKKKRFKNFPLAWYADDLAVLEFSNFGNIFSINNAKIFIRLSNHSISGSRGQSKDKDISKFKFYLILISRYRKKFNSIQNRKIEENLWNAFFNRIKITHYFFILFYYILSLSPIMLFKFHSKIFSIIKSKFFH